MPSDFNISPIEPTESERVRKQEETEASKLAIAQETSQIDMQEYADEAAFNPIFMARRFQSLEEKIRRKDLEKKESANTDETIVAIEKIEEISEEFEKRNPELSAKVLQLLRSQIKADDTAEEILNKILKSYPDPSLADESLEFLEKSTKGTILSQVRIAKENLNATLGSEIRAGRNIGAQARAFSEAGLGSPTGLRDLYRAIIGNPRDAITLFEELNEKFSFSKMQTAIDFILHSLGSDLKSKGPSISPGELHALMTEARNLLAILWVYRFFRGRMDLIRSSFERGGMLLPSQISFELLAKIFMQFLKERYPSMDKVFQLAMKMGISSDLLAQVILFTQMRDAVRGVAPKLFRTEQHRHDVLMSFIEALEEIEEKMEEKQEDEDEEQEEQDEEEENS